MSRPLTQLTKSAEQLSAEELPAMVESLRTASRNQSPTITPITAKGRDEVASLSRPFSTARSTSSTSSNHGKKTRMPSKISSAWITLLLGCAAMLSPCSCWQERNRRGAAVNL